MRERMHTLLTFLAVLAIGFMTMPHDVELAFAQSAPPLGTPRFELIDSPEEGVRVYRSVGLEHTCYLAVAEWDGIAAGKSSSLSCP